MPLKIEPFVFDDVNPNIPALKLAAKRYTSTAASRVPQSEAVTLFLAHGVGNHKEHWEVTLEKLFALHPAITEAWSFDLHSHGEGAVLNENVLQHLEPGQMLQECLQSLVSFLQRGIVSNSKIVAIGHSVGVALLVLASMKFGAAKPPFTSMILVEPALLRREAYERSRRQGSAVALRKAALRKAILARRDTWPSKEHALQYFGARAPWKLWDPRVLALYVDHGLRIAPSPTVAGETVATLKCTKWQEDAVYDEPNAIYSFQAYEHMPAIAAALPMHLIFAERDDLMPRDTQDLLIRDINPASVIWVPNVGHQLVHEAPIVAAEVIAEILKGYSGRMLVSKL